MRVLWSWICELLPEPARHVDAAKVWTSRGIEVERVEAVGDAIKGVVVAQVVSKKKHPQSDKLTVVEVLDAVGGNTTTVVCGAPNVPEPGGRVLWARPGAELPGPHQGQPMVMGKKALRGVESAGMLCSETELGLGDDESGIVVLDPSDIAELGQDIAQAFSLKDTAFEVSTATNRPDLLSHLGLARELALDWKSARGVLYPEAGLDAYFATEENPSAMSVEISEPSLCSRYVARRITGIKVQRSPLKVRWRLKQVGVRAINNVVDVTNYVLFELGQPLHAFDYQKVPAGKISVRRGKNDEKLLTLDNIERSLGANDLVIAGETGGLAVAGVMGGATSSVNDGTTSVLLESAAFAAATIRKTARSLNLHSESSHRFERGVDAEMCDFASRRAAFLMAQWSGGKISRDVVDMYPGKQEIPAVALRSERATAVVGIELDGKACASLLEKAGCKIEQKGHHLWVEAPSYRPDLLREIDLIEECIRVHGYDKVPSTLPPLTAPPQKRGEFVAPSARRALVEEGFDEVITYGFTSPDAISAMGYPAEDVRNKPISLKNPMSVEQSVMRTALLPGLLSALSHNIRQGQTNVRIFEVGSVFLQKNARGLPDEPLRVAGVVCGERVRGMTKSEAEDFFSLRGSVERLWSELLPRDAKPVFEKDAESAQYHPGLAAKVVLNGKCVGRFGEIHPSVRKKFELDVSCFGFEFDLSAVTVPPFTQMQAIPKFPETSRDISFFVDVEVPASRIQELLWQSKEEWLCQVRVIEDFRDPNFVPAGKKGMLWSLTYRSAERTLTDAEVETRHERIVAAVLPALAADRR